MHAPLTVSARTLLLILLAVVLATGALVSGRPAASAEADPVRIMPLGDSITGLGFQIALAADESARVTAAFPPEPSRRRR